MKKHKMFKFVGWLLLAAFLAVFAGCAGGGKQNLARGLNQDEAEKLLALHSARQKSQEETKETPADPKRLEAHGDGLALAGDWMGALFQYHRALGLVPPADRQRLRAKTAEICLRARQFAQAETLFKDMTAKNPKRAAFWQGLGLAYMGQGKLEEAQGALQKAVSLKPALWKAQNALGVICNYRRLFGMALKRFDLALTYGPQRAELYNNRGMAYLLLGKEDKATADFRRATALDPGFELAHNNLALVMAKEGRLKEALKYFSQGMGAAQAHNNLGCLLAWKGNYGKASEHFQTALNSRPRYYPLAGQHLAQVGEAAPEPSRTLPAAAYQADPVEPEKPIVQKTAPEVKKSKPRPKVSLREKPRAPEKKPALPAAEPPVNQAKDQKPSQVITASHDQRPGQATPLGMVALVKDSKVVKGVWVSKEEGVRPFEPGLAPGPAEPVKDDAAKGEAAKGEARPAAVDSTGKARPEAEQHALNHAIPAPKTSAEPVLAQKPSTEAVAKAAKAAKALEPLKIHEAKAAGSPAIWRGTISTETISQGGEAENAPGDVKQTSGVRRSRPIGG